MRGVEPVRPSGDERSVFSERRFAGEAYDAVAMMVVEVIHEFLVANHEGGMISHHFLLGLRQREAKLGKPVQALALGA